jgi:transcriptional regulator with XRE-family HTH domain
MVQKYKVALGKRLKAARLRAGLSQTEVAMRIGKAKQSISHWEQGVWAPEMATLIQLAEALGVSTATLTDGVEGEAEGSTATRKRLTVTSSVIPLFGPEVASILLRGDYDDEPEADKYIGTLTKHSTKSVAVTIPNKSNAPKFVPGDVITIDPDVSPDPGQFVLAWIGKETLFGRFLPGSRGSKGSLSFVNRHYSDLAFGKGDQVLGTMREHISQSHD